jgi:hypothetical protein
MNDWIVAMLNVLSSGDIDTTSLIRLPSQYSATMYTAMTTFQNVAVKPITAVVLSIMLVLMLQNASTRADGNAQAQAEFIVMSLIKASLIVAVLTISGKVMQGIDELGVMLMKHGSSITVGASAGSDAHLGDTMKASIDSANWGAQAAMLMIVLIPWIVAKLVTVLPTVMIFWRFIQLDLLTAFSSLPLAFLAHEDTKQIGIGYLKRYATITLQGVVLIAGIKLYQALIVGWVTSNVKAGTDPLNFLMKNFGNLFVGPIILALIIVGSTSIAKAIVGEG